MVSKAESVFNFIFQSNSLKKNEKQEFVNHLEEILGGYGFKKVSKIFGGDRKQYKSVRLEKLITDNKGQWIEFVFEKYGKRCFHITIGISETVLPNKHILVGNVIRSKKQRFNWWGSQWYSVFRYRAWIKATNRVLQHLPQLVAYLDDTETGDNIHHDIVLGSRR